VFAAGSLFFRGAELQKKTVLASYVQSAERQMTPHTVFRDHGKFSRPARTRILRTPGRSTSPG
jgi:hypothetical protein